MTSLANGREDPMPNKVMHVGTGTTNIAFDRPTKVSAFPCHLFSIVHRE